MHQHVHTYTQLYERQTVSGLGGSSRVVFSSPPSVCVALLQVTQFPPTVEEHQHQLPLQFANEVQLKEQQCGCVFIASKVKVWSSVRELCCLPEGGGRSFSPASCESWNLLMGWKRKGSLNSSAFPTVKLQTAPLLSIKQPLRLHSRVPLCFQPQSVSHVLSPAVPQAPTSRCSPTPPGGRDRPPRYRLPPSPRTPSSAAPQKMR